MDVIVIHTNLYSTCESCILLFAVTRANAILPVVVGGNGKHILYAPAARYVRPDVSMTLQVLLDVFYHPRLVNLRISHYNFTSMRI